jgi:hypothetical protein
LRIEAYFQQLREAIDSCPIVRSFNVTYDKRGSHEGFIRGEVYLVDGSILHLREFVDVEIGVDRLTYVYQYMSPAKKLIFRYDNTGHHKKLNLPTYPHHKHEGSEHNVVASSAPDLAVVLSEIETLVELP